MTNRISSILLALLLCSCSSDPTGTGTGSPKTPIAKFAEAAQEWDWGNTILTATVRNVGDTIGEYRLDIMVRDASGRTWLARETPAKGLPLGVAPVRHWLVADNELLAVTLVRLYTLSAGVWTQTDSLTETSIEKTN